MISLILVMLFAAQQQCVVIIQAGAGTMQAASCPNPLKAASITLPIATTGQPYSADVTKSVTGGVAPYVFTATSDLNGLTLSQDGKLTGTPIKAGTFNLTWNVKDSAGTVIYVQ